MIRRPQRSTRTDTLFPYTTLFRSRRTGGNRTELDKGVFSPCDLCEDDPTRAPLWQLKAVKIIHDQETKTIEYQDAWMEIYGIPVLYTPYMSHPDPTVKRKSGFLAPSFGEIGRAHV